MEELGNIDLEDLITEETMVVSISHQGYIKRTAFERLQYAAARRQGAQGRQDRRRRSDPASVRRQHARVLAVPDHAGKVTVAEGLRSAAACRATVKGRAIVNLLNLESDEKIAECLAIRDFDQPGYYVVMATRSGLVKKTPLEQYSRPEAWRHHRHQAARR